MKKTLLFLFGFLFFTCIAQAETLKMKNGNLISGSILSQTEYVLNLATSYGNITLNQRDIEQILPDKHRIILNGGTQLVGIILDMDEFNLTLQTDDEATVNIDIPQIISIESYDYDLGKNAQQEFVQKQIEQTAAEQEKKAENPQKAVEAAGGLSFDSDIDKVFGAQQATVIDGKAVTPSASIPTTNSNSKWFDEEESVLPTKEDIITAKAPEKEKIVKKSTLPREKDFSKYFSIQAGAQTLDLKLSKVSLGSSIEIDTSDNAVDVGGTSPTISTQFLWRISESNLWLGPTLSFASIPNTDIEDTFHKTPDAYDVDATAGGSIFNIGALAHYYINPQSRFSFYLAGSATYEALTLNYRGTYLKHGEIDTKDFKNSVKSNGFVGTVGLGVETWIDDIMLGLEIKEAFSTRKEELKGSASANTIIQAQASWKF